MSHDGAEELRRVQAEVRCLRAELAALSRVVAESIVFQALMALDADGDLPARAGSVVRLLRTLADLQTRP